MLFFHSMVLAEILLLILLQYLYNYTEIRCPSHIHNMVVHYVLPTSLVLVCFSTINCIMLH